MESSPGVFALLLGSGVSREAGIPTGWEVTLDLIEKLAELEGEDTGGEPAAWYREQYNSPPEYSDLLNNITQTPAERREVLRGYFEPTEEEREQGIKTPTAAHEAVAELVGRGYVRLIITTNFDRLVEEALEAEGITPDVISTADQAQGAPPLIHSDCTVLKVNGDYLDERIRNTPEELEEYPEEIDALLDRALDEFGMVVCGWSAEWDVALRSAIERCPNRRYSTYWTRYGDLTEAAERLIEHRDASVVDIEGAEDFFTDLAAKVIGLEERAKPHPASAEAAVGMTKRFLSEDRHRIQLDDLVMGEAHRVQNRLSTRSESLNAGVEGEELLRRVQLYEDYSEILEHVFAVGCYWGTEAHRETWSRALESVANPSRDVGTYKRTWVFLLRYPALLLLYSGGISALARDDYGTFQTLLTEPQVRDIAVDRGSDPLVIEVNCGSVMRDEVGQMLPGMERRHVPLNDWLFDRLRTSTRRTVPDDRRYERIFNRFEYLTALVYVDLRYGDDLDGRVWGPAGRFGYKWQRGDEKADFEREVAEMGADWPPLQMGLFNGSLERFVEVKAAFDEFCWQQLRWW